MNQLPFFSSSSPYFLPVFYLFIFISQLPKSKRKPLQKIHRELKTKGFCLSNSYSPFLTLPKSRNLLDPQGSLASVFLLILDIENACKYPKKREEFPLSSFS
jgi:hypothetical protein